MHQIGGDFTIIGPSCIRINVWFTMIYERECSNIKYWYINVQSYWVKLLLWMYRKAHFRCLSNWSKTEQLYSFPRSDWIAQFLVNFGWTQYKINFPMTGHLRILYQYQGMHKKSYFCLSLAHGLSRNRDVSRHWYVYLESLTSFIPCPFDDRVSAWIIFI